MRRTVVIDDALLEEARAALGGESIRSTIEEALRGLIRRHQLEEARKALGIFDHLMTVEELLEWRGMENQRFSRGERS
ncbi:MAG: type II toxin-antitoxin system VapB family antitoxin [Chloroflexota bacterium]